GAGGPRLGPRQAHAHLEVAGRVVVADAAPQARLTRTRGGRAAFGGIAPQALGARALAARLALRRERQAAGLVVLPPAREPLGTRQLVAALALGGGRHAGPGLPVAVETRAALAVEARLVQLGRGLALPRPRAPQPRRAVVVL